MNPATHKHCTAPGVKHPIQRRGRYYAPQSRLPATSSTYRPSPAVEDPKSLSSRIFRFVQSGLREEPHFFLSGNFAPVTQEVHSQELEVAGAVPPSLSGWFIKTGPNPQFKPHGGYHWFDGEGMLHAVVLEDGVAKSYSNHWVRCHRFNTEAEAGRNIYMRIGDMKGVQGLAMMLMRDKLNFLPGCPPGESEASGNTSVHFHGGRLLAFNEGSLPFQLRMLPSGLLESVGSCTFDDALTHPLTAHPKIDHRTGEMVTFTNLTQQGTMLYTTFSADGKVSDRLSIDMPNFILAHDFAITETYAVFMDHNLGFDPKVMIVENTLPFRDDTTRRGRIGLLQRSNLSAGVKWFEVQPFVCFHTVNAWEEGDTVNLVCCRYDRFDLAADPTNVPEGMNAVLSRYTLNTATGKTTLTALTRPDINLDFPTVAPELVGRRSKYAWCVEAKGPLPVAIVKVDLEAEKGQAVLARINFPDHWYGGEYVFVSRDAAALAAGRIESDDGYLVGYTTNETTLTSYCMIYDARTMSPVPLAKITLPQRVPYNFHGTFVPRSQLEAASAIA